MIETTTSQGSILSAKKRQLAEMATRLRSNLTELKRPLMIEFTGCPKAGKTTCVDAISKFFRRHNIPVHVVTERASVCPISDKHHPFFNVWTGCTSLANMLEAMERRVNVVILDRGLFDTLVWINFHASRGSVSRGELEVIESFLLLERWTSRIDIVAALSVSPTVSIQREFKDQITDLQGSVMNTETLNGYKTSLERSLEKYKDRFRQVISIDTTDKRPVEGVAQIAFEVLSAADLLVDEKIAVVERQFLDTKVPAGGVLLEKEKVSVLMNELVDKVTWAPRSDAEKDASLVQIVPVSVIVRNGEILVANIRGGEQGKTVENKNSIWAGGHARFSDLPKGRHKKTIFRRCLIRELDEELRIRLDLKNIPAVPNAVVWDKTKSRSLHHCALFFECHVGRNVAKASLHQREFWESPTKSLFTQFLPLDENLTEVPDWEAWSILYLKEAHNIGFPAVVEQIVIL